MPSLGKRKSGFPAKKKVKILQKVKFGITQVDKGQNSTLKTTKQMIKFCALALHH